MEKRRLGNTGIKLTTVGLGTWAMGGPWEFGWGPQDDAEAVAAIVRALELGINWIDTAPAYGLGHSEELVARALKQTGARPFIATKCGILWDDAGRKISCLKKQSVLGECDDSLRRLDVETIDLYQMHWPVPAEDVDQAWEAMIECLDKGKVRHIGVCNFNVAQMRHIVEARSAAGSCRGQDALAKGSGGHRPVSLQPPYSMVHREVEAETLAYCAANQLGVVVYSPMQRGLLTGAFNRKRLAGLASDDHRLRSADFQEPAFSATLEMVEKLRPIARDNGKTLAQLAVAWTLRRPEVTAAIVGARRPGQIEETVGASGWRLTDDEIQRIEALIRERNAKLTV